MTATSATCYGKCESRGTVPLTQKEGGMHMTDRKIRKSALCITMSLVLTLCGCAAAAPASGQGSTGQEASGQGSTMQANAGQEVTGEATPGQEATGQEATAQEANGQEISAQTTVQEDEFDFEEGDQSTPAAEEMPSKFDLRDVQVKGSGPLRRRRSAFSAAGWRRTTVIQQRLSICRRSTCRFLPTLR